MSDKLAELDRAKMDSFLGELFEEIVSGFLTREDFVEGMAHVFAAVHTGRHSEVADWFECGIKKIGPRDARP